MRVAISFSEFAIGFSSQDVISVLERLRLTKIVEHLPRQLELLQQPAQN